MSPPDVSARTSRKPEVVEGVTFRCYRRGVLRYALISDDGRAMVQRNYEATTYSAWVDDKPVAGADARKPKRFQTESAALAAAVRQLKGSAKP